MNEEKAISKHFTKASASTAASRYDVTRHLERVSSPHVRARYKVVRSGTKLRRWKVIEI